MVLNEQTVNAYKELLINPQKHNLKITSITDFFAPSEIVIAKDILAKSYIDHINKPVPKIIIYIIMDDLYGACIEKDSNNGNLGYKLTYKQQQSE
ncbi:hypothetical protein D0T84_16320 [Dysgonomonas sp. 521]|uniref:hypothetical protein n=1 Tax=Dysgonomonas sp. 521 TaxID=2302932 RepID=UPI0013D537DD|nr:hypothetical protein [Dysgonomonas sp. 521]NDV96467.1 hypothetical protein [Dysgonomonas sp. 521]